MKFEEKYSLEYLKELAKPYMRRIDFKNEHSKEYFAAQKRGILDEVCSHMPKKKENTLEEIIERARPYRTSGEFYKGDKAAYQCARKHGWMDIVCSHMDNPYKKADYIPRNLSNEQLAEIASDYDTKRDFMEGDNAAYNAARRRGILNEICQHMTPLLHYYTIDDCLEEASKYDYRKAFEKGSPKHYDYARRHGWLDEVCAGMEVKRQSWPKAKCMETASLFETIQEWRTAFPSAYEKCHRKGWLEEATSHMKQTRKTRTKDECQQIASNYRTRVEFKEGDYAAYSYAQQHGWLDEICKDMEHVGDVYWRMLYVYEFADHSAYVGLTCDFRRRDWQHRNETSDPVYKHIQKCNDYKLIQISDYIPKEEAAKLEDEYIERYKSEKWKMLNSRRGGSLGFPRRKMKTKNLPPRLYRPLPKTQD